MSFPPRPISGQCSRLFAFLLVLSRALPTETLTASSILVFIFSTNAPEPLSLGEREIKSPATHSSSHQGLAVCWGESK